MQAKEKSVFNPKFFTKEGKSAFDTYVCYRTYNAAGKLTGDSAKSACFSAFTYQPVTTDKIEIYQLLSEIPYGKETITNWIAVLNELGFPCTLEFVKEHAHFTVLPKNFTKKFLFNSTLQLIRCLYENYIFYIPDIYFALVAEGMDKFKALQVAHLNVHGYKEASYANSNHMITSSQSNSEPLTKAEWEKRLAESQYLMSHTYDPNGKRLYQIWTGKATSNYA